MGKIEDNAIISTTSRTKVSALYTRNFYERSCRVHLYKYNDCLTSTPTPSGGNRNYPMTYAPVRCFTRWH